MRDRPEVLVCICSGMHALLVTPSRQCGHVLCPHRAAHEPTFSGADPASRNKSRSWKKKPPPFMPGCFHRPPTTATHRPKKLQVDAMSESCFKALMPSGHGQHAVALARVPRTSERPCQQVRPSQECLFVLETRAVSAHIYAHRE